MRERRGRHDPVRVIRGLAVMLANGGDRLSDLRAVRDQEPLFGPVASDATAFRLIDRIAEEPELLDELRAARARARERAWELGMRPERIMIDIDATSITAHTAQIDVLDRALAQLPVEVVSDQDTQIVMRIDAADAATTLCQAAQDSGTSWSGSRERTGDLRA